MKLMLYVFISCLFVCFGVVSAEEQKNSTAAASSAQNAATNMVTDVYQSAVDLSKARQDVMNVRRSIDARRKELIKENPECLKIQTEIGVIHEALRQKTDQLEQEFMKDKAYQELNSQWREKQKISYDVLSAATAARKSQKPGKNTAE